MIIYKNMFKLKNKDKLISESSYMHKRYLIKHFANCKLEDLTKVALIILLEIIWQQRRNLQPEIIYCKKNSMQNAT